MGVLIRFALLGVLLAGCFSPDTRDGVVACGADSSCPPDFQCNPADRLCYRTLPPAPDAAHIIDASTADAAVVDAGPPDANTLPECSDGKDNDCDGRIDFGVDPGCDSGADDDEHGALECDDGIDNDGDNNLDYHISSPQCTEVRDSNCNGPADDNEN
jgi:hypothetical protein